MQAVLGDDPRPNCLVIDEIDGSPQATINVLLSAIQAESKPAGRKKGAMPPLMRPIICICNDQYVPSLRQLRSIALILNFPPTESTRLAVRLSEIIRQEDMRADMNTLLALCQKAGNDVRSCLNTLQFVHSQARTLTTQSVRELNVGQKDAHHGLFSMWQSVFSLPRDKKNHFVNVHDLTGPQTKPKSTSTPAARFHRVLAMTQATGEYEKLVRGLFENYLEARCKDPYLEGLLLATGWLGFVDEIDQYTGHSQDYSLMKYVSFLPVVFHFIYASFSPNRIQFPHSFGEYRQKLTRSQNLVGTLMADMAPRVRNHVQEVSMVTEVLPPLMDIIQPTLRPVNTQLYSAREKESMACLVHTMISYNLTYIQDRGQDGQYTYLLEPNIEELVRFSGQKQRRQLTYAARQLIAREIELEKMRRSDLYSGPEKTVTTATPGESKASVSDKGKEKAAPKPVMKELRMGDFFQRFKRDKPEKPEKKEESSRQALLATDIWFHFTEGFSNAVRRNVRVQDFM